VGSAVREWVSTGIVPPGVALPGFLGSIGGAVSTLAKGAQSAISTIGGLLFKRRDGAAQVTHPPAAIQARLGDGEALDGNLQARMGSVFAHDFSGVRVHKDANAAQLSSDLSARAFTVGRNVAFGAGEYQPGTPIGDALIAHELAHVAQQGGVSANTPLQQRGAEAEALEEDADTSAVRAVTALWSGAKTGVANVSRNAIPALKSGLRLQRCEWLKRQQRAADVSQARSFFKKYKFRDKKGELIDPDKLSDDELVAEYKEFEMTCIRAGYYRVDPDCVAAAAVVPPLARDATGKVHGDLPGNVPKEWTKEQLEEAAEELEQSIARRKAEQLQLGEDPAHRVRISQEEDLLRQIRKKLSGS
jgi:hypothetical protein